jgi:hypothetical protein
MRPNNNSPRSYLLYCIYSSDGQARLEGLTGMQGQTVESISVQGLCALVSALTGATPAADLEEIKSYGRVVAACHRAHATIPMRFGAVFKDKPEIAAHLAEQGSTYKALLQHLTDCEEIGIRLLLPKSEPLLPPDRKSIRPQEGQSHAHQEPSWTGKAYLTRQKERYDLTDDFQRRAENTLSRWRGLFDGLYMDCCWERPRTVAGCETPILSAYFLVRRQRITDFKKAFVRISQDRPEKALLSGPWPPYNFVQPQQDPSRSWLQSQEFTPERDRA